MNDVKNQKSLPILVADDDEQDCMLTEDALRECNVPNPIHFVRDGVELMRYLRKEGEYAHAELPGLILLDLNMPRKNGHEALQEIKNDPKLRSIPVIILTTSESETDVLQTYELGSNSFITKPVTYSGLVEAMRVVGRYWLEVVKLPGTDDG